MHPATLYETHTHTRLCKHASCEPSDYAEAAWRRGFDGLMVTCHNPMPDDFSPEARMDLDEFDEYLRLVYQARQDWVGRVDVRLGLEVDYFPGYEPWLEHQLQIAEFQYVLGSVHPQTAEYIERYWTDDSVAFQKLYFRMLADAAETGLFDCLSHPDLVKNSTPDDWQPTLILEDICQALDRIAATGVGMEVNTSGIYKAVAEVNPFPQMLVEMRRRQIPVVIGADAHEPWRVGDGFLAALDLLEDCGYRQISFFVNRDRHDVCLAEARSRQKAAIADAARKPARSAGK